MAFQITTAVRRLRRMTKRIRVIPGGTSAGKTYGILPILIDQAARVPGKKISVVSESIPHLKRGTMRDFEDIMRQTGRWIEEHFNKTDRIYKFHNGSFIEFFSADDEARVRGARRTDLFINECNNIRWDTYYQLAIRTSGTIWLDFNPDNEFWVHEELADDKDAEWLTLTYLDNEAIAPAVLGELLKAKAKAETSSYWRNWWMIYGLGQVGKLEGVIFSNWEPIAEVPPDARLIGYALDFGFTNDPTTLVAAYEWKGVVIWDELLYRTGMTNGMIATEMKKLGLRSTDFIVADSSEPKSIREINEYGFNVQPAVKGRDSINFGISVLQEAPFLVTSRSVNMIKELRRYAWATDRTGKSLNVPIDSYNHCIDPMRYLATAKFSQQKKKRHGIRRIN